MLSVAIRDGILANRLREGTNTPRQNGVELILARDGVPGVRGEGTGGHADSGPVGERRKSNRPRIDSERGA